MFSVRETTRRARSLAVVLATGFIFPAFPIIGIGAHYGLDLTMKMDNKFMEQTDLSSLKFSLSGVSALPSSFNPSIPVTGKDVPVFINRKGWENTGINLGGKLYVDIIPFVDAVEISANFGVWQYEGSIVYPNGIRTDVSNPSKISDVFTYDTMDLTLKNLLPNKPFWGLEKTPYAKLHCDATVRKYLLKFPPVLKTVKLYAGLGMSVDFATPALSSKLISDALGSDLNQQLTYQNIGPQLFANPEVMKKILNKILDDLMTPHYGCHIAAGTSVKIPAVPIGVYIDGKYIIMFDKLDKNVDVGGSGLLLNVGLALVF
jgi:hypothetical protein